MTAGVLLADYGWTPIVFEASPNVGGLCADCTEFGITRHLYGPHVFHTNYERVYEFFTRFTDIVPYKHRVMARVDKFSRLLSIPYSKLTAQELGRELSDKEVLDWFFKPYSKKMWGLNWDVLPDEITGRVPKRRADFNSDYFTDRYQGLPKNGYMAMFDNMRQHICTRGAVYCDSTPDAWRDCDYDLLVYTGSLDTLFDYRHGALEYKTVTFAREEDQPLHPAVVNECNMLTPATRVSNYGQLAYKRTTEAYVISETPVAGTVTAKDGGCFYPLPWYNGNDALAKLYEADAIDWHTNVVMCGRLGSYKYMNMDQVVDDVMEQLWGF